MNKEEQFKEFIEKYKNENFATLVELVSVADFDVCGLADYLHTHRTKGSVVSAIQDLARKEAKEAEKIARVEEQRTKQVADPLAEKKPAEPTIKEEASNPFMCMCFIPTDVKQAIQNEMERRAENDPTLKAFLPNVSYTDVYNRIAAKLQDLAKSAPREGGVAAVHFSDADTYALAEYLIRNQLTEREKAEKAKAKTATPKPAEKKKDEPKPTTPSKPKTEEKVVSMIPTNATKSTKQKSSDKTKQQIQTPSLFDF